MLYIWTRGLIKRFLQYNAHYYSASDSRWCKHKRNLLKRCWVAPRISRKILGSGVMYPGTVPQVPLCNRASDDTSALLTTRLPPPPTWILRLELLLWLLLGPGFNYPQSPYMPYGPRFSPTQRQMAIPRLQQVIPNGRAYTPCSWGKLEEQTPGALGFSDGQGHQMLETKEWQILQLPFRFFWFVHTVLLSFLLSKIYPWFKIQWMFHFICEIFSDSSSLWFYPSSESLHDLQPEWVAKT